MTDFRFWWFKNGFDGFCQIFVSVSKKMKMKIFETILLDRFFGFDGWIWFWEVLWLFCFSFRKTDILIYFTIENNKKWYRKQLCLFTRIYLHYVQSISITFIYHNLLKSLSHQIQKNVKTLFGKYWVCIVVKIDTTKIVKPRLNSHFWKKISTLLNFSRNVQTSEDLFRIIGKSICATHCSIKTGTRDMIFLIKLIVNLCQMTFPTTCKKAVIIWILCIFFWFRRSWWSCLQTLNLGLLLFTHGSLIKDWITNVWLLPL